MKIFKKSVLPFLATILFATLATRVKACDLCGCYLPGTHCAFMKNPNANSGPQLEEGRWALSINPGPYFAVAEQFTHFGTIQSDGVKVPNPTGQYLNSSITQFVIGYGFNNRFSLQVNIPHIHRQFLRPNGFAMDRGTESGLGDLSILGNFLAWRKETGPVTAAWRVMGGVKFPTGSSARLDEELHESEVGGAPASGIHGHDLTRGSGSVDGVIGTSFFLRWRRAAFTGAVHYSIRSTGSINYRFANDLTWNFGPGVYLLLDPACTVLLQANFSGEHKGLDSFSGQSAGDTGVTAWYVGPELVATLRDTLSAELGVDLPISIRNTALQSVPDYRLRASVTVRF